MRRWITRILLGGVLILASVRGVRAWDVQGLPLTYTEFATGLFFAWQVGFDAEGDVYVAGYEDCNVTTKGIGKFDANGNFISKFGACGSLGVAVRENRVYVVDYGQDLMELYDTDGNQIDVSGTDYGTYAYSSPYSVAVDSNMNVYVSNANNNEIVMFDSNLALVRVITGVGGAFNFPEAVAVDGENNLYVADSGNNRVQKFDSNGNHLMTITGHGSSWNYPEGMAVDPYGNVYVVDSGNNRIQIFSADGTFRQEITAAMIDAQIPTVSYLVGGGVDAVGNLYVGDMTRLIKISFDRVAPTVNINTFGGNVTEDQTPVLTGTITDASTLTGIEYRVDDGDYRACAAVDGAVDEASEEFRCELTDPLLGSHTVTVRATDSSYNQGSTSYTFVVNKAAEAGGTTTSQSGQSVMPGSAPIVSVELVTETSVTLGVLPGVGPITGYNVAYSTVATLWQYGVGGVGDENSRELTIAGLEPNTLYYFRVTPVNEGVEGAHGPVVTARTGGGAVAPVQEITTPSPTPMVQRVEQQVEETTEQVR